jgi:uncharacterized protein
MLVLDAVKIPEEGLEIDAPLEAGEIHLEPDDGFELLSGGRVVARAEKGEGDAVHVRGRLDARLGVECSRCLERFAFPVDRQLDLFYLPRLPRQQEEEEDVELQDRDLVVAYYAAGRIDVGDAVREQLILALPMKRLCREGCRGLCPVCGGNRNERDCGCALPAENVSPFAKLLRKGTA